MGFEACLREDAAADLILLDTLAATTLGVSGTPTFLLNDLLVPGFLGSERMDSLVEGVLQKVRGAHEDP
jgi:protein-disulfide isomerase